MEKPVLIFDLGNVMVTFLPLKEMQALYGKKQAAEMYEILFPDLWNAYDQGLLCKNDLIEKTIAKNPDLKEVVTDWMESWTQFLIPYPENVRLLMRLKERNFKAYILSNINEDAYLALEQQGFFNLFDGGIYSYQEKIIKPDPQIYHKLLDTYQLEASKCLFIDDNLQNVQGAVNAGIPALHLQGIEQLELLLKQRLL